MSVFGFPLFYWFFIYLLMQYAHTDVIGKSWYIFRRCWRLSRFRGMWRIKKWFRRGWKVFRVQLWMDLLHGLQRVRVIRTSEFLLPTHFISSYFPPQIEWNRVFNYDCLGCKWQLRASVNCYLICLRCVFGLMIMRRIRVWWRRIYRCRLRSTSFLIPSFTSEPKYIFIAE